MSNTAIIRELNDLRREINLVREMVMEVRNPAVNEMRGIAAAIQRGDRGPLHERNKRLLKTRRKK